MAFFTNADSHRPSILLAITDFFRSLGAAIDVAATSNARVLEMEKLNALSDAELSAKGLRREDIARHVFRDILYL